jgi:hypothetical protein
MHERTGVTGLVNELAGEILRIFSHPHIVSVPAIVDSVVKSVDPPTTSICDISLTVDTVQNTVGLVDAESKDVNIPSVQPPPAQQMPGLISVSAQMQILKPTSTALRSDPRITGRAFAFEEIEFPPVTPECPFTKIATRGLRVNRVMTGLPKIDWVFSSVLTKGVKAVKDIDRACKMPVILKAAPWSNMDRHYIVSCWGLLHAQADEEFGIDPERSLEMLAIFQNVDMSLFSRTQFYPANRELHLYPLYPGERPDSAPLLCAIIIGTIRGTGKLLQAVLSKSSER